MLRAIPVTGRSWPRRLPGFAGPGVIEDTLVITTPNEDSQFFARLRYEFKSNTAATFVVLDAPARGRMLYIYACQGWHTDSAGTRDYGILGLQNLGNGNFVTVEQQRDIKGDDHVWLTRPIIVPHPWAFGYEQDEASVLNVQIRAFIIDMDEGEPIPRGG